MCAKIEKLILDNNLSKIKKLNIDIIMLNLFWNAFICMLGLGLNLEDKSGQIFGKLWLDAEGYQM